MEVKIKKNVENTGEIKLGDIFYCEYYEGYYMVVPDDEKDYYYLQNIDGRNNIFSNEEYDTLYSLRGAIDCNQQLGLVHYPSSKYYMELTKYPEE